jgi:hypothetical protein
MQEGGGQVAIIPVFLFLFKTNSCYHLSCVMVFCISATSTVLQEFLQYIKEGGKEGKKKEKKQRRKEGGKGGKKVGRSDKEDQTGI